MIINGIRVVGAVMVGLIVAFIGVVLVELGSSVLHPFPPGFDPHDFEACKAHVARYPAWVLALAMLTWGLTVFAGSWVSTRLGARRHPVHGIVVGTILLAAAIFNMAMLPYPIWFWGNVVLFPACCLAGVRLAQVGQAEKLVSAA